MKIEKYRQISVLNIVFQLVRHWLWILLYGIVFSCSALLWLAWSSQSVYEGTAIFVIGYFQEPSKKPLPLDDIFILSRVLEERYSNGVDAAEIKTKSYENDFNHSKRMTLEVSIRANSKARVVELAHEIWDVVHARSLERERDLSPINLNDELALIQRFISLRAHLQASLANFLSVDDEVSQLISNGIFSQIEMTIKTHKARVEKYKDHVDAFWVVPTRAPYIPNLPAVRDVTRDAQIVFNMFFFGVLVGAVVTFIRRMEPLSTPTPRDQSTNSLVCSERTGQNENAVINDVRHDANDFSRTGSSVHAQDNPERAISCGSGTGCSL